ncbi:MAG: IclR family transcriptional regulator [Clostridia bacterium]|nr:IclR family transcriptional regulator [Clostridia bacterium]
MSEKSIQVIERALDILELLATEKEGLGVTEIGNRLSLHKSTVHRILSALAERGYIEKISNNGLYKIGLKMVELSSVHLSNVELKTEARPYLWELTSKLNLTTHLAILEGADAIYIEKVDVVSNIRLYSQIGRRIPVYCSALGKSLLSGLTDDELDRIVSNCSLTRLTDNTLTDRSELIRQIKKVRITGWSIDDEEHDEGIRCIAAPVLDYRGKVIAALSISGPASVVTKEKDQEFGELVSNIAFKISNRLGYKK